MNNRVLVTGGLGYLGGRLGLAMKEIGCAVRCGTRRSRLSAPAWFPDLQMAHLNWESVESLAQACQGVDSVIHLAAMNEVESTRDPVGALKMNGLASLRLLEAAKLAGVRRFIYFSTAHVYGSPLQGSIDEKTLPRPVHPYAISHKVAEDFVLAAHDRKEIEGVVVRLSNSFGVPVTPDVDRWTLLVNDLCRQAAKNGELRLNSSGTQLRDFITLSDVTRAVNHLLQLGTVQLTDGLFNLGSGKAMSIFEMAETIARRWQVLTGREIPIVRQAGDSIPPPILNYRCDKLVATGFTLVSEVNREIDDTLKLCQKVFGK